MSTAQHTPRPWFLQENSPAITSKNREICTLHIFDDTDLGNARLISNAPEMFDLLAELIDTEGAQPGTSEWAQRVHALLAKIKGETP